MSLWSGHKHGSSSYRQLQKQRLRCIERLQGEAVKLREQQAFSDSLSLVDEKMMKLSKSYGDVLA